MTTKHVATDSTGKVHRRSSKGRVYSHCVVVQFEAVPRDQYGHEWPAHVRAEWASTLVNAQNNAARWQRAGRQVEIIEAQVVP